MIVIQHLVAASLEPFHSEGEQSPGLYEEFLVVVLKHISVWHWWIKVLIFSLLLLVTDLPDSGRSLSRTWWSSRCHDGVRGRFPGCWEGFPFSVCVAFWLALASTLSTRANNPYWLPAGSYTPRFIHLFPTGCHSDFF